MENNPLNRRTTIVKENDVNYKITQISFTANVKKTFSISDLFYNKFIKKILETDDKKLFCFKFLNDWIYI